MKNNICKFCNTKIKGIECHKCGCLTTLRKIKDKDINSEFTDYCYNRYASGLLNKVYYFWLKFTVYLFTDSGALNVVLNFLLSPITGGKPVIKFGNKDLIDVGCGRGDFIQLLPRDWNKEGSEIVKYKNLPKYIRVGNFEKINFKKKYGITRSSHSLEHSLNPKKFLDKMVSITEKGGIIIILTPNSDSLSYRIFKDRWAALQIDSHFCILNIKSVGDYLISKKCKIIYSNTYSMFQTVGSLLEILKVKNNNFLFFIIFVILYFPWMLIETFFGRADSFILYAKKL